MFLRRFLLLLITTLSVCSALAADSADYDVLVTGNQENVDPWESVNRRVFGFNEGLDQYFFRPVAKGYRWVTPDPVERSVTSFLSNLGELNNAANSLLQGRPSNVFHNTGRFLVNTTVGLGGLFDVASHIGVEPRPADFGQTLSVWGVDEGPFLVVPLLGPRTLRGGAGIVVDGYISLPNFYLERPETTAITATRIVDTRARLLDAEELISGDKYIFTRNAYLQRRHYFLNGGVVQDSFSEPQEENYEDF